MGRGRCQRPASRVSWGCGLPLPFHASSRAIYPHHVHELGHNGLKTSESNLPPQCGVIGHMARARMRVLAACNSPALPIKGT